MGKEVFKVEIDKLLQHKKELIEPILNTPANRYLELAINTTKLRKRAFGSLGDILKKQDRNFAFLETAPFAIASKEDPTQVIVYPNLPRSIDPIAIAEHTVQMWTDGRKRRKIEDPERAETYAMKREVTSFGKFLGKHSNLPSLGYKDDQIRSFCEKLSVQNAPPTVIICETPEDYYEMYKVKTGSCMEVGSSYWGEWSRKTLPQIADDTGIHMGAWLHYAPWCCGAYVVVANVPVARFILYREDLSNDKWEFYGDMHGSSINYGKVVDDFVAAQGLKRYGKAAKTIAEFRVPGMTHPELEKKSGKDQLFCPLPNVDNQIKDFDVCFDKLRGDFVFFPRGKGACKATPITSTYDWEGFIPSSRIAEFKPT